MFLELYFLYSDLDLLHKNLQDFSEEYGERFYLGSDPIPRIRSDDKEVQRVLLAPGLDIFSVTGFSKTSRPVLTANLT